ncbi:MAG TPA: ATP-binding protein [Cellvibrionaceae bacterium]
MKKLLFTGFTGRLFLWFWLSLSVLLLINFLLAHYVNNYPVLTQPNADEVEFIARIESAINRFEGNTRDELKESRVGRWLVLYDESSLQPVDRRADHWRLPELVAAKQVSVLRLSPEKSAAGPFIVPLQDGDVRAIWIMPPRVLPLWQRFFLDSPLWRLSASMILVLVLSLTLAQWLSRPIRQLSQAARELGKGKLDTRVEPISGELGQLGQEFNTMAASLQKSIDAQQRLLADVSHELRSPLTRLKLAAGLLADKGNNSYLQRIEKECDTLEHLVEQVLTLSRLEGSLYQEASENGDLAGEVRDIIQDWRFQAPDKQIDYQGPEQLEGELKPQLLKRVLDNLLSNACRYGQHISVSLITHPTGWQLSVTDDGPGLENTELEHLFEPFYRADPARGHKGNVGLGLAIAQAAARAQNGHLTVHRTDIGGLCFTLHVMT